jgi:hypothetical protein
MKNLSKKQILMLEGIRVLSTYYNRQLEVLIGSVAEITGEKLEDNYGLAADFIYTPDESVEEHLRKLNIS